MFASFFSLSCVGEIGAYIENVFGQEYLYNTVVEISMGILISLDIFKRRSDKIIQVNIFEGKNLIHQHSYLFTLTSRCF